MHQKQFHRTNVPSTVPLLDNINIWTVSIRAECVEHPLVFQELSVATTVLKRSNSGSPPLLTQQGQWFPQWSWEVRRKEREHHVQRGWAKGVPVEMVHRWYGGRVPTQLSGSLKCKWERERKRERASDEGLELVGGMSLRLDGFLFFSF